MMPEKITAIGLQASIDKLEDESKSTYKYLSILGSKFVYKHYPEEVKQSILNIMTYNDLAEGSFAGVTAHC